MLDMKHISKKVELRRQCFSFDLRDKKKAIGDFISAAVVIVVALVFASILFGVGCDAMGITP